MNFNSINNLLLVLGFLIFVSTCSDLEKRNIKTESLNQSWSNTQQLLKTFSVNITPPFNLKLIKESVVESDDNIFFDGYIKSIAVDSLNRLFIGVAKPSSVGIYVFNEQGEFIKRFGEIGRGPGEYETLKSIKILGDRLFLFDSRLQKMGVFSTIDFSHIKDEVLKRKNDSSQDSLVKILKGAELYPIKNGGFILEKQIFPLNKAIDIPLIAFYKFSDKGEISNESTLKIKRAKYRFIENKLMDIPFVMPFTRNSVYAVSDNGEYYTAWNDKFLLELYDSNGEYLYSISYPYKNSHLIFDKIKVGREQQKVLDMDDSIPKSWPLVHAIELDDINQIWVALITESDSTYLWHVLNKKGELQAKFELEGSKLVRDVILKPIIEIKNGFFYYHERDINKGIDRIVKYKIEFKKRE